jgi:hypothetical protein
MISDGQLEEVSISFRIINGDLYVVDGKGFPDKKPPGIPVVQMTFPGFNKSSEVPIFKDLLSYPEQGRIYVGLSTHQTTGCCSHFSARFVPTVCICIYVLLYCFFFL